MKLVETEQLAGDLEKGLGEVHWAMKGIYPWLRLRTSVCAVTSLAVSQGLRQQGYDVELVAFTPTNGTLKASKKLAKFIVPEHIKLVA